MVSGTAGNNINLADGTDFLVRHSQFLNDNIVFFQPWIQSIADGSRLFMHLFQHEVFVSAFFRRVNVPVDVGRPLFQFFFVDVIEGQGISGQLYNFFILHKIYITGIFQNRRNVRRDKIAFLSCSDDQRAVFPHRINLIRMISEQNSKGVRPLHPVHDLHDGVQRVSVVIVIQHMGNNFRIRFRYKLIAAAFHFLFQFYVIFDDSVVDHNDGLVFIEMRMGVGIGRAAVSRPAGMTNPGSSRQDRSVLSQFFQHLQTACSLHHLDLFPIIHSHSCRIISSVLQFGQPVQQDRRRLLFSNISYNSTHVFVSS